MSSLLTIVAGTASPVYFQILDEGEALDLTDFTVTLTLTGVDGIAISTTSKVSVPTGDTGLVKYTPASGDLTSTVSPVKARWILTEDTGNVYYIPTGYRDEWDIISL